MAEYIEREAAIEAIMCEPPDAHYPQWYADKIKAIPSADVVPVVHGRWINTMDSYQDDHCRYNYWECSSCGNRIAARYGLYEYCPNCGAKMDGGNEYGT